MIRRYLIALVGALAGGGAALVAFYMLGVYPRPLFVGLCAIAVAGFLMAKGEDLGLVPASDEIGKPTTLFSDEQERRR